MPVQRGARIAGRFELEHPCQAGGMGTVWRARDLDSGRPAAIKLLRAPGPLHEARFSREAALLASLDHPAIVRSLGHGRTAGGELYLAMEWLEGEDLAARLARGKLAVGEALMLVGRICEGLAAVHATGAVHRDLKPANLFLVGGSIDQPKILDFGIARVSAAASITEGGMLMGTPGYTAPEQARGAADIDARADVFALGCLLYECLAGQPAFSGEHVMAVLARILLEDPPRLAEMAAHVPAALDALVTRMLAKERERRPEDAGAVLDLLGALDTELPRPARGTPTPRPPTLGRDEQRFMSLILVSGAGRAAAARLGELDTVAPVMSSSLGDMPTVTPSPHRPPVDVTRLLDAHAARLEILVDGTWLVVPGGIDAAAATDQAAAAARLALAMAELLPGARVGLSSGRGVSAGRVPVGEVIDRAVGLLGAAHDAVVVDELTSGLLAGRFHIDGEQAVRRLVGERQDAASARTLLGRVTPFVGRERELSMLVGLFEGCVADESARAVLVRAPAGFGKSRLREELLAALTRRGAGFELLGARGDPVAAGSPFGLAAQVVRRAAGLTDPLPEAEQRARLRARLARVLAGDALERAVAFLGELCDLPAVGPASPALAAARRDAWVMGDQIRRAWDDWVEAETRRRPVILVLEDLHHGDLPSVNLVDSALRNLRERPLLVVALARPEVRERFPALWAERAVHEMPLAELSRKAAGRLVRDVLGPEVSAADVDRLVAQSAGNAFYLEELIRVVADGGAELPGTVLAMAQARLDALEPAARRLLRAGAIFGDRFPRDGVLALLGGETDAAGVDRVLEDLVDRELLVVARGRGEGGHAFRHALVREAAYAMLTATDRALGHRLAAEWLEQAGERDAVLLAEHWTRGGVSERAVAGLLRAAREALEGNDMAAVLACAERGLGSGAGGDELGELLYLRTEAHRWRADYSAAAESGALALAAMPPGSAGWYQAATAQFAVLMALQGIPRVVELADRVIAARWQPGAEPARARALSKGAVQLYLAGRYDHADRALGELEATVASQPSDPAMEAVLCEARAFREGARAHQGRCLALLRQAGDAHERAGDFRNAIMQRSNVGYTYLQLGAYRQAIGILEVALAEAERMGLHYISLVASQNLCLALVRAGELGRGEKVGRAVLDEFDERRDLHMAAVTRIYLADGALRAGDLDGAERLAQAAAEAMEANPPARAFALAQVARVRNRRGAAASALAPAREAYALLESLGGLDEGEILVRLAHVEALAAAGRIDEARAVAAVARRRLDTLADALDDTDLRTTFLSAVEENAALIALADRLGA